MRGSYQSISVSSSSDFHRVTVFQLFELFFSLNADPEHNPYVPKKKPELELEAHAAHGTHGAFLINA